MTIQQRTKASEDFVHLANGESDSHRFTSPAVYTIACAVVFAHLLTAG